MLIVAISSLMYVPWFHKSTGTPEPPPSPDAPPAALLYTAGSKVYVSATAFQALKPLVPELPDMRLGGLARAGQELWERGGARIPAETNVFSRTVGERDLYAMVLASGPDHGAKRWALAVERTTGGWSRLALVPLEMRTNFDDASAAEFLTRVVQGSRP